MDLLKKNIRSMYGKAGEDWLNELPHQIEKIADLWQLRDLTPFTQLSYNYVLSGWRGEEPIVLKLSINHRDLQLESMALCHFKNHGSVALLEYREGAMLLQRAIPGTSLKNHPKALEIGCRLAQRLHTASLPMQHSFPHIKDQLAILDKEWALPKQHIERARFLKNRLLPLEQREVLLHGDLHQENICSNGEDWLAIDPKGVIGYPINEIWTLAQNPDQDLSWMAAHFGFSLETTTQWYYIHLILAACYQQEDRLDPSKFLNLAERYLAPPSSSRQDGRSQGPPPAYRRR